MIMYKASCSEHNYESRPFMNEIYAVAAAARHRRDVDGPHDLKIIEVYIPDNVIQVKSIRSI